MLSWRCFNDEKQEVREANQEILAVIRSLGGGQGGYRRERKRALRHVVSEIYSLPRVTAATKLLPELRLIPGFALELTTVNEKGEPWNFDLKVMRDEALRRVREERRCGRRSPPGSEVTIRYVILWLL